MADYVNRLRDQGVDYVAVIYVSGKDLFANTLQISYVYATVCIPVRQTYDCTFISVATLRPLLLVDPLASHESEWLVLNRIPSSLMNWCYVVPNGPAMPANPLIRLSSDDSIMPPTHPPHF